MEEEDLRPPDSTTSFHLPPGSRFHPSEQQLICYYLTSKNHGTNSYGIDVIKEIDLYNFDPFDLPESSSFRYGGGGKRRHWYCYVRTVVFRDRGRRRRAAGIGYWKKRSRVRDVVRDGAGKVVVGTRRSFDFYLGGLSQNGVRTHWVMYEYALVHHHMGSFVLCRVFYKPHMGRNVSEHIISSCGDESVATVRHMGVQFDGTVRSDIGESKIHGKDTQDDDSKVLKVTRLGDELDATISHNSLSKQDLRAIREEDFIELDDLLRPLQRVG